MTGTALTEEKEFRDIYGMDVIEIPTNEPVQRMDLEDAVYKTQKEKFKAVYETLATCTPIQRERFFVHFGRFELCGDRPPAGLLQVCRKRFSGSRSKKITETFDGLPPRKPTFWLLSEGL